MGNNPLDSMRMSGLLEPALPNTVAIAQGASLSAAIDLRGKTVVRIVMPASWDTANLTFQGSDDGVTYNNIYDSSGTEYTVTAAASRRIQIPPADFLGNGYLKVRSGTAGSAVNQTAARTITLVAKGF